MIFLESNIERSNDYQTKKDLGIVDNKTVRINSLNEIVIHNFRKFIEQSIQFGSVVTAFSGRNGTMKSTILGLISHPFSSDEESISDTKMSTKLQDVLNLSIKKDNVPQKDPYSYELKMNVNNDKFLKTTVSVYLDSTKSRHRIVVSGSAKGDGTFNLPVQYLNFRRLFPIVDSTPLKKTAHGDYTENEKKWISTLYQKLLLRDDFAHFTGKDVETSGPYEKHFNGPNSESSKYDVDTISSGEDEIASFADAMISLQRVYDKNKKSHYAGLTGILAIDEFEAGLHPSAQINLFNFIYNWARAAKVQVILNTHSIYLIQQLYDKFESALINNKISLNFIESLSGDGSHLEIYKNPKYELAYKELTLQNLPEVSKIFKPKIMCEDDVAEKLICRILKTQKNNFQFHHQVRYDNDGTTFVQLFQLSKAYPYLLEETNSIVIFDADVNKEVIKDLSFKRTISVPSVYHSNNLGFPIEKDLIIWILNKPQDDSFFGEINKEQDVLRNEWANEYNICLSESPEAHQNINTKRYKNWAINNKGLFNKCLTRYINQNTELFSGFKSQLLIWLNELKKANGD